MADEVRAELAFPVVGIGASSGGLEALEAFFERTPADSGMAFVIVQHASPQHQSLLAQQLRTHTRMPVHEVEHGVALSPDHIYVNTAGSTLTLKDGRLERSGSPEARGGLDDFLRSLAAVQQRKAVAVVLSGSGTQGIVGAQAIRAAGGICIAQDPAAAAFPGMPSNLICAGQADRVCDARDIPDTLRKYARHEYVAMQVAGEQTEMLSQRGTAQVSEILHALRSHARRDFSVLQMPALWRRIQRRMALNDVSSVSDYAAAMRNSPSEIAALAEDLMSRAGGFFRDRAAWEALRSAVIAPLVASHRGNDPIRAWVAACGRGEEAYTLALLFAQEIGASRANDAPQVKIFATDPAEAAIASARAAVYPTGIATDLSHEHLERFFERDDYAYRVKPAIRGMVVFANHDLLRDPPFSQVDLCICRELLAGLELEARQRAIAQLHFGLRDGGHLLLGRAEPGEGAHLPFEEVSGQCGIYRRPRAGRYPVGLLPAVAGRITPASADPLETPQARAAQPSLTLLLQRALLERFGPPTIVVDRVDQVIYFHGRMDPFLQYPSGSATHDLLRLIRPALRLTVRTVLRAATRENRCVMASVEVGDSPDASRTIEVTAAPVLEGRSPAYFMVSFREAEGLRRKRGWSGDEGLQAVEKAASHTELQVLRQDLQSSVEACDSMGEELEAANAEAAAISEELQSRNEELETNREELQSVNCALHGLNAQLQSRIAALESSTGDLTSVLSALEIGIMVLTRDYRIRYYNPFIRDVLDLTPGDLGRPLTDLAWKFTDEQFLEDVRNVLADLSSRERQVRSHRGDSYLRRISPHRWHEDRVDAVIVMFIDKAETPR